MRHRGPQPYARVRPTRHIGGALAEAFDPWRATIHAASGRLRASGLLEPESDLDQLTVSDAGHI